MISLDGISGVLLDDVAGGGQELIEYSWVGSCAVGIDLGRVWTVLQRVAEERRVAAQSLFLDTSTSMTCPHWSIARYRYEPAISGGMPARPCRVDQ